MKSLIITFLILLVAIAFIFVGGVYYFFFDMTRLGSSRDELLLTSRSPSGDYKIEIYRFSGGATVSYAILGKLYTNEYAQPKNIYWGYKESEVTVIWLDEDTVTINGQELNVPHETYDWRRK